MPVRQVLLLVLPDREIYEYLCIKCSASIGRREVETVNNKNQTNKNIWTP